MFKKSTIKIISLFLKLSLPWCIFNILMSKKKFVKRPLKIFIPKILDRVNSFFPSRLIYLSSNYLYLDIPKSASSFIKSTIINSSNLSISCGAEYPHSSVFKRPPYENINRFKIYSFIRDHR